MKWLNSTGQFLKGKGNFCYGSYKVPYIAPVASAYIIRNLNCHKHFESDLCLGAVHKRCECTGLKMTFDIAIS